MNGTIILITFHVIIGLMLLFIAGDKFKREQGYQIAKAGYLLAIIFLFVITGKTVLFYIFLISCILDVFCTVLYYEANVKKDEEG